MRIFVNATPLDVPDGSDVGHAVAVHDAALAEQVAAGTAYVTDARGIEVAAGSRLEAGSILRVVVRARRGGGSDDADT